MRKIPWLVFALVFGWKIALFVFSVQPVPANDAFFYDGAVIHHLLHGGYYNPSIALALPISGTEVFSVYPPLYQLPLLVWLSVFGVSALTVMTMHLTLFGLYLLVLLAIFKRLQTPAWCINLAGIFLLTFTFTDRPDSFAHLLGVLALYACVRSWRMLGRGPVGNARVWVWAMVLFIILTLCTSLQIGGFYFGVVLIATVAACHFGKERIPFLPLSLMVLMPIALVVLVKIELPRPWAGFLEHAQQTPSFTGFRIPHWQEAMKIVRTVPGIILITILLPWTWSKLRQDFSTDTARRQEIILLAALLPALGIVVASLSVLTPNTIAIANYLQPLIVAAYLSLIISVRPEPRWLRFQIYCLVPAMLLGSVRAVGMTTWGLACAADVSYSSSVQKVEEQLIHHPAEYKVVISSAFLYDAAKHGELTLIHSDWMTRAKGDSRISDSQALLALKPEKIILTQYDYYRRFKPVLESIKGTPSLRDIQIVNTAHTRSPDSYKSLQQVVQHISWAPVIITLSWQAER